MNWYEIVLGVVLIAVSVLIVVFTLAQEQKGQGLSGASWAKAPPRWQQAVSAAWTLSWPS